MSEKLLKTNVFNREYNIDRLDRYQIIKDCRIGEGTVIWNFVNLYGCTIGKNCMIGSFVEIQPGVIIGDHTRIQGHTFICSKVTIGRDCFIGHGVTFCNDRYPPSHNNNFWENTDIQDNVSIGNNCVILPVCIGKGSSVGAGSVVTRDIPPGYIAYGNPARVKSVVK